MCAEKGPGPLEVQLLLPGEPGHCLHGPWGQLCLDLSSVGACTRGSPVALLVVVVPASGGAHTGRVWSCVVPDRQNGFALDRLKGDLEIALPRVGGKRA